MKKTSRLPGFYKKSPEERLEVVGQFSELSDEEKKAIRQTGCLTMEQADRMVENLVGTIEMPLGIAANFLINGKDYLIPMATEEPSVIAAASNAARMVRSTGGFFTSSSPPFIEAQILAVNIYDPGGARMKILENKDKIIEMANTQDPVLIDLGGGIEDVEVRVVEGRKGFMVITHLVVNTLDAMGANTVNRMAEFIAPFIEEISGGKVYLRVIDNYATKRLARARCVVDKEVLGGERVVDGMIHDYLCAYYDQHRATGHNKGTMNGITAVVLATGNDTRAVESGFHSYAARGGQYRALPVWEKDKDGNLVGSLELPVAIGIIGGATHVHPTAKAVVKILGVKTAREFGEILAAVGLASKLAAERALADEGIMKGHMKMHARNIAVMAGAAGDQIDEIANIMIKEERVRSDRAKELLEKIEKQ